MSVRDKIVGDKWQAEADLIGEKAMKGLTTLSTSGSAKWTDGMCDYIARVVPGATKAACIAKKAVQDVGDKLQAKVKTAVAGLTADKIADKIRAKNPIQVGAAIIAGGIKGGEKGAPIAAQRIWSGTAGKNYTKKQERNHKRAVKAREKRKNRG